jgi:hypothetical protein
VYKTDEARGKGPLAGVVFSFAVERRITSLACDSMNRLANSMVAAQARVLLTMVEKRGGRDTSSDNLSTTNDSDHKFKQQDAYVLNNRILLRILCTSSRHQCTAYTHYSQVRTDSTADHFHGATKGPAAR